MLQRLNEYAGWYFQVYVCLMCAFQEGILHLWKGGLVVHLLPLGVKRTGGCERWGARSATPNNRGKVLLIGVSGTATHKSCFCSVPPMPAPARSASLKLIREGVGDF